MRERKPPSSSSEFERAVGETADFLAEKGKNLEVEIFSHGDADGAAASALLISFLHLRDIPFHLRFTGPFGTKDMIRLAEAQERKKLLVFLDQGSGEVEAIQKCLLDTGHHTLLIDHHQGPPLSHPSLSYLNPHHLGVNGGIEVSAAGLVYCVVERLEKSLRRLVWLAVVGALGDRQEGVGGFLGLNRQLVERAVGEGRLKSKTGLRIARSGSLFDALYHSVRPYLPGISGNEKVCSSILEEVGVERSSSLEQVGEEEKILDSILSHLSSESEQLRHALWGPVYSDGRYVHEEATIAQACGMMGKPELGFGRLLGDPSLSSEAHTVFLEYVKKIIAALQWLDSNKSSITSSPHMRYVRMPVDAMMAGEVLSLGLEAGVLPNDLPVIALVESGNQFKISGRVHHLTKGYNLGLALNKAARKVGGAGGGHDASAAAYIPKNKVEDFLLTLEEALSETHETAGKAGVE